MRAITVVGLVSLLLPAHLLAQSTPDKVVFDPPSPCEGMSGKLLDDVVHGLGVNDHLMVTDSRGRVAIAHCRLGDGDGGNGIVFSAVELYRDDGNGWVRHWRSRLYESTYQCERHNNRGRSLHGFDLVDWDDDGLAETVHSVLIPDNAVFRTYVRKADGSRIIAEVAAGPKGADLCDVPQAELEKSCPAKPADITFYAVDARGVTTHTAIGEAAKKFLHAGTYDALEERLLTPENCVLR